MLYTHTHAQMAILVLLNLSCHNSQLVYACVFCFLLSHDILAFNITHWARIFIRLFLLYFCWFFMLLNIVCSIVFSPEIFIYPQDIWNKFVFVFVCVFFGSSSRWITRSICILQQNKCAWNGFNKVIQSVCICLALYVDVDLRQRELWAT